MSEEKKEELDIQSIRVSGIGVLSVLAVFLTFTLPLKFGVITGLPEAPTGFPLELHPLELYNFLIYMFWPVMLFPLFSSFLLLGVLILSPPLKDSPDKRLLIPLSWILLFLSVLPGFINASMMDFPIIQTATISGYAAFAIAIYRLIELRPEIKLWLLNAVIVSSVITVMIGLTQYFFGFRETLDYVYRQEIKTGVKVSSQIMDRLRQKRVYSTFSICNSLAAHIILILPVLIWGLFKSKIIVKSIITTVALSALVVLATEVNQILFFPVAFLIFSVIGLTLFRYPEDKQILMGWVTLLPIGGVTLWILYLTQSRGGLVGLGTALIFFIFIIPIEKGFKFLTAFLILGIVTLLLIFDIEGRHFASFEVRLDYCLRSLDMFLNHPFVGTGWGDFFHEYMKTKQFLNHEAPHNPHNFIMSFASQAGITGLLASIVVFFLPFYIFFKKIRSLSPPMELEKSYQENETGKTKWLSISIVTGWCAWAIHSLADFNIQIQGTVATAIILLLIMNSRNSTEETQNSNAEEAFPAKRRKLYLVFWYGCVPIIVLICMSISIHQLRLDTTLLRMTEACGMDATSTGQHKPLTEAELEYLLNKCTVNAGYSPVPWMFAAFYAEKAHRNWVKVELYCKEAIKRSPERASIYFQLYVAQKQLGKKHEAIENLKRAAEMFPAQYEQIYVKEVGKNKEK